MRAGSQRPTPTVTHTGTSGVAGDGGRGQRAAHGHEARRAGGHRLQQQHVRRARPPRPGPRWARRPRRCRRASSRRTSPLPSPSESTASTSTSPRRGSASPTSSGQPITQAVASARERVGQLGRGGVARRSRRRRPTPPGWQSGAVSTRAQSHHSGAEVGMAVDDAAGGGDEPGRVVVEGRPAPGPSPARAGAWSAPEARATYRSRSIGCTGSTLRCRESMGSVRHRPSG